MDWTTIATALIGMLGSVLVAISQGIFKKDDLLSRAERLMKLSEGQEGVARDEMRYRTGATVVWVEKCERFWIVARRFADVAFFFLATVVVVGMLLGLHLIIENGASLVLGKMESLVLDMTIFGLRLLLPIVVGYVVFVLLLEYLRSGGIKRIERDIRIRDNALDGKRDGGIGARARPVKAKREAGSDGE